MLRNIILVLRYLSFLTENRQNTVGEMWIVSVFLYEEG